MATPPLPDDPGVLAGPAHHLPGADANAVVLPVAVPVASDVDPLGPASDREGPCFPLRVATLRS